MECPICWTSLQVSANAPSSPNETSTQQSKSNARTISNVITPCGHTFHRACILEWFKQSENKSCPKCRCQIKRKSLYPVFLTQDKKDKDCEKKKSSQPGGVDVVNSAGGDNGLQLPPNCEILKKEVCQCDRKECQELHQRNALLQQRFKELEAKLSNENERADTHELEVQTVEEAQQQDEESDSESSDDSESERDDDEMEPQPQPPEDSDDEDEGVEDWDNDFEDNMRLQILEEEDADENGQEEDEEIDSESSEDSEFEGGDEMESMEVDAEDDFDENL